MSTGPSGPPQAKFEDGLRFLAAALALEVDHRNNAAIVTTACDAIQCFLVTFELAARHALEGARLARDQAAQLLPRLLG